MRILRKLTAFVLSALLLCGPVLADSVPEDSRPFMLRASAEQPEDSNPTTPAESNESTEHETLAEPAQREASAVSTEPAKSEETTIAEEPAAPEALSNSDEAKETIEPKTPENPEPPKPAEGTGAVPEASEPARESTESKEEGTPEGGAKEEGTPAKEQPVDEFPVNELSEDELPENEFPEGELSEDGLLEDELLEEELLGEELLEDELLEEELLEEELLEDELLGEELLEDELLEEEEELPSQEPGTISLGHYQASAAEAGGKLTFALSLLYTHSGQTYYTNQGVEGDPLSWSGSRPAEAYDQSLTHEISELRVEMADSQQENYPFVPETLSLQRYILSNGQNTGFAVFEDLPVRENAEPGSYPIYLNVFWLETHSDQWQNQRLTVSVDVLAKEEPGTISLGHYQASAIDENGLLSFALSFLYARGGQTYYTNEGVEGDLLPWSGSRPAEVYDQSLTHEISELRVEIAGIQQGNYPLAPETLSLQQSILFGGQNAGFAAFENLPVRADVEPGTYPIDLNVFWLETHSDQWQNQTLTLSVDVPAKEVHPEFRGDNVALGTGMELEISPEERTVTIAIPITYKAFYGEYQEDTGEYETVEKVFDSNANTNAEGEEKSILTYGDAEGYAAYDQETIITQLPSLSVEISDSQAEDFPLDAAVLSQVRSLITDTENKGYAVFEDLPLADAEPGVYPVNLEVAWQNTEGEARTEEITLFMDVAETGAMLYEDNGIIVFTHTQLKQALTDAVPGYTGRSFDPIYLGYCDADMPAGSWETRNNGEIKYPTGVLDDALTRIPVARSVTIIGTDPRNDKRITVVDRPIPAGDTPSYVSSGIYANRADIVITVKNVNWDGHNQNGIVMGYLRSGTQFIDVKYTGSRMYASETINSWVSLTDCHVYITDSNKSGSENGQEVAKAGDIRLYGNTSIIRDGKLTGTPAIWYAVFWVDVSPHKVTVYPGANVTVDSNNYFLRQNASSSSILDIQGSLDLTTRNTNGCVNYVGEWINNMTVSGSLKVTDNGSGQPSLRAASLTVTGSLEIEKTNASSTDPCIMPTALGTVTFDSPKFVSLKNAGGALIKTDAGTVLRPVKITTQVMNLWPSTGGVDKYIWNNNDLSVFTANATLSYGNTAAASATGLYNGTGVSLQSAQVGTSTFNLSSATRLECGQYALSIDPDTVRYGSAVVSGSAPSGSTQTVREYNYSNASSPILVQSGEAVGDTEYRTGGDWAPISSFPCRVYVLSRLRNLEAHIYEEIRAELNLYHVPPSLNFGTVTLSGQTQWIQPQEDWKVQVYDTRPVGSWILSVSADPLTSTDGQDTLTDALVFIQTGGSQQPLSSGSLFVTEKQPTDLPGITDLVWEEDEGFQVHLTPSDGIPGKSYTTTITWTLEDS